MIRTIGIVGCGVIGGSWAAHYLARGYDVVATDPAEGAERKLRQHVRSCWPALMELGLQPGATPDRLSFASDLAVVASGADFVQESGPERLEVKRQLVRDIDAAARPEVLIATSSSGLLISDIQTAARTPERVLLGHPYNPPHIMPLVEVIGGRLTSPEAIAQALTFYVANGKKPIHVRSEVRGHLANRLQAALVREAFYLLEQGVGTVADIDAAVTYGPGLRWALLGPFMTMQVAGGEGGIAHVMEHIGPAIESWWQDMKGISVVSDQIKAQLVAEVGEQMKNIVPERLIEQRDALLLAFLKLKAHADSIP
jgi:carnitine 3-dehydrogenase